MQTHVLVVSDDYTIGLHVAGELLRGSHRVTVCTTAERALARVQDGDVDVVLTDGTVPGVSSTDLRARAVATGRDVSVVVTSAHRSMDETIEVMRSTLVA